MPDSSYDAADVFTFSPSAIATWREGCHQKLGFRYIDKIESESGAGAKLGTLIHSQLEQWYIKKKVPAHDAAKRLLVFLPSPKHPNVKNEHYFDILFSPGKAHGYIDLLITEPVPKLFPRLLDASEKRPYVCDFKTTSNLDLAYKSPQVLQNDPQAILYGVAARLERARETNGKITDFPEVDLHWAYTSTKKNETRQSRLRQTLPILEDGLGKILEDAHVIRQEVATGKTHELPYDLNCCDKYGGCPYKVICKAYQTHHPRHTNGGAYETDMNSALMEKLKTAGLTKPKAQPEPDTVQNEPAPTTEAVVKPSPEPDLPKPNTSGLNVPIPPGSAPINSPQAAPNVSPTDPPVPEVIEPAKKSRKKKTETVEVLEGEIVSESSSEMSDDEIVSMLKRIAIQAIKKNDVGLASSVLDCLRHLN